MARTKETEVWSGWAWLAAVGGCVDQKVSESKQAMQRAGQLKVEVKRQTGECTCPIRTKLVIGDELFAALPVTSAATGGPYSGPRASRLDWTGGSFLCEASGRCAGHGPAGVREARPFWPSDRACSTASCFSVASSIRNSVHYSCMAAPNLETLGRSAARLLGCFTSAPSVDSGLQLHKTLLLAPI